MRKKCQNRNSRVSLQSYLRIRGQRPLEATWREMMVVTITRQVADFYATPFSGCGVDEFRIGFLSTSRLNKYENFKRL